MASEEARAKNKAEATTASINLSKIPLEEPADGGIFEGYSNVVNMNWTLYDVRLRFGELIQVPDDDHPTWENQHGIVLERAAVTIPWHQAKYLRNMLDDLIKSYEELNGELKDIKLPAAGSVNAGPSTEKS